MTKAEFNQAMSVLTKVRSDIDATHVDIASALKTLHAIEAEILDEQPEGSPWKQHLATIEQAKKESHTAIHRLLGLADHADSADSTLRLIETTKLTETQRKALDADPAYQSAEQRLANAAEQGKLLRKSLFEADADWVSTNEGVLHARQQSHAQDRELRTAAVTAGSEKIELGNEQRVAAMARAIIAQGEMRLRQLGVKTATKPSQSKPVKSNR